MVNQHKIQNCQLYNKSSSTSIIHYTCVCLYTKFKGYEDLDTWSGSKDTNLEALHFVTFSGSKDKSWKH